MAIIPSMLLKRLYTVSSLQNTPDGVQFSIKNRLSDARITELQSIRIDDEEVALKDIVLDLGNGRLIGPREISESNALDFPLRQVVDITLNVEPLPKGKHTIELSVNTKPFGRIRFKVDDSIAEATDMVRIPRSRENDHSQGMAAERRRFVESFTGAKLEHVGNFSFDPAIAQGNIENFTGVSQIPLGIAGPIKINGEYARGEFLIPLATTEGTLVASYNRGIKLLNLSGGVTTTVSGDAMQRAPVFVFRDARGARDFVKWVLEPANYAQVKEAGDATSSVASLQYIDTFLSNKFAYLRFNYSTGDAAGQNMVGRATFAACSWILDHYDEHPITNFYLESNLATDKKASQVNLMRTRGKRVTAEATIPRDVLIQHMRVEPEMLANHALVANVGAILSGANNNGLHSANAITALFIATGQDVANVSESSAGIIYTELTPDKDLYLSITIPSLIVATYGGGVGLATQRECLEMLGCVGKGNVMKFAEIVGAVVLAGELSLAAAISSSDWVSSHERYGRNR